MENVPLAANVARIPRGVPTGGSRRSASITDAPFFVHLQVTLHDVDGPKDDEGYLNVQRLDDSTRPSTNRNRLSTQLLRSVCAVAVAATTTAVSNGNKNSAVLSVVRVAMPPMSGGPSTKPDHPHAETMAIAVPACTLRMCPQALNTIGMTSARPTPRHIRPIRKLAGRSRISPTLSPITPTSA